MNIPVNLVAVGLAGIASMILGFIYYSPMVLGKPWMKEKGLSEEKLKKAQKEMGKWYGLSFVVSLITAYVLAHVMFLSANYFHYDAVMTGLTSGFFMWIGFILPTQVTAAIFGDKNFKLLVIDTGYQLVSILTMGMVLGLIK